MNDFSPDQEKGNIYLFFGERGGGGGVFVPKKVKNTRTRKNNWSHADNMVH